MLVIIFFAAGILVMLPCDPQRNYVCDGVYGDQVGQPLFMGSFALALVFLILLFLPQPYFKNWLKYAAWYIPVAALWIIMSDVICGGGLGLGMCFDKELATWWSSGIYLILSLVVIAITYLKRRNGTRSASFTT